MKPTRRITLTFACLSVLLVLCMSVGNAWAYFTDNSVATGGFPVVSEPKTEIVEEYGPGTKKVTIYNTGRVEVWVRARVYASPMLQPSASGPNWTGGPVNEDWYNYDLILEPGENTEQLEVNFALKRPKTDENPTGAVDGDETNVIIVYESTPVVYDADGNALPPVWNE